MNSKILLKVNILTLLTFVIVNSIAYSNNFESGIIALKNNDLSNALKYFTEATQETKNNPNNLYYLGITLKKMNEYERAVRAFETALKLKPYPGLANMINNELSSLKNVSKPTNKKTIAYYKKLYEPNYIDYAISDGKVCHWDLSKMPLKIYISDGKNIDGYQPSFRNSVINAFRAWQNASGNTIRFIIIDNPDNANIKVSWIKKLEGNILGVSPLVRSDDNILRLDVVLATTILENKYNTPTSIFAIALHEIGHALGIAGHSPHKEDIMYYSCDNFEKKNKLSKRDINTLILLYQLTPDISNKLPVEMSQVKQAFKLQLTGDCFFEQKKYKEAIQYYLQALKICDKEVEANYKTGICYLHLNNYLDSIKYLEKAETLKPDDPSIKYNIAVAMVRYSSSLPPSYASISLNYYKKAFKLINEISTNPDRPKQADTLSIKLKEILNNMTLMH